MDIGKLKGHELLRQEYRLKRYMEHLNEIDLRERAKDVFNNLVILNKESKISLPRRNERSQGFMVLWTHILEEFALRFGPVMTERAISWVKEMKLPSPQLPLALKAANKVKHISLSEGEYFFKYGKSSELKKVLNNKVLRILPASSYKDPSLNPAIRDNELEFPIYPLADEVKIKTFDKMTGGYDKEITPQNVVVTSHSQTDYYVYCLSLSFEPRLFLDFEADACLIIRNTREFQEVAFSAFKKIMTDWIGEGNDVAYIDPLGFPILDIDVFFSKHFRYSYQMEYRLVWVPSKPVWGLQPVQIEVPNLTDFCYLVDLSD